jgi:polyisoprenyl-phosphate glycosyltransferase
MKNSRQILSLVIPVYFEELVIEAFYRRVLEALAPLEHEFDLEMVFVNDGSTDRSLEILLKLHARDPRVKILNLSRNFGHQIAITAGIDHISGEAVVIIDADLQDPPEVIMQMLSKWREGYKVVYGVREKRRGESIFKRFTAKTFYRIIGYLSDTTLPLDTGDFRLMDRSAVEYLRKMREESRYMRGMISWLGFRQCGVNYIRDPRFAGNAKYTLAKMLRFAFNGITSFSEKPLVLAGWLGMIITACGFFLLLYIIAGRILNPQKIVSGWSSLMGIVVFFGGIQLLSLGVMGQYIGRIYREVKRRPLYIMESAFGIGLPSNKGEQQAAH